MSKKEPFIKQIFKTLYANIKSWGWYEWVKYTIVIGLLIMCFFVFPLLPLLLISIAWLIIKDYRISHLTLIVTTVLMTMMSLRYHYDYQDTFPQIEDVIFWLFSILSVVCIYKITTKNKTKKKTAEENNMFFEAASLVVIGWYAFFIAPFVVIEARYPDYEHINYKECLKEKTAAGYPEEFVREYCYEHGRWCGIMRYSEDCEPEHCCFMTLEEDKKWNYLDYDENGNKIKK